ncbi:GGDEF domain-containing protein [[Clostridium] polysaccharolyticum]|uniref:Diguanylate cyclase (GGDEF) domain-containing protein n=1 Tax=[Clostridium] polysaccharolyticum TaxID=29364 RepID=A0A1I0DQM9_9FIRM|nr:GGDEF domain-containing protein [[Clostridium] polysaccharolyticum]SET34886.1 diguanylate cyclase (GGDEF) domain-containing protein [[Clostridium] polysaccharolyticum]
MITSLYFEICVICIISVSLLIASVKKQCGIMFEDRLFLGIMWTVTGIFLSDGAWILVDGLDFPGSQGINKVLNFLYYTLTGIVGLLWLLYTDYKIYESKERLVRCLKWYVIPCVVLVVIILLSPWTGWIFSLSKNEQSHRGRYYALPMLVAYGYLLWAEVQALSAWKHTERKSLRKEYKTLGSFIIWPVLGSIMQGIVYGYPMIWVGVVISVLKVYVDTQNQQITRDGLTGVNNRRYLNHYLDMRLCKKRKKQLFFILMDIDSFKEINDNYGHTQGDAAIIRIAGILREICYKNNDFLARYGGDEFAIVCERENEQEVENLLQEIKDIVFFSNQAGDMKYDIWLSIGYAEYGESQSKNQDELIALADKRLYEAKKKRKQNGNKLR